MKKASKLQQAAEARLGQAKHLSSVDVSQMTPVNTLRLVHDLQVHQIELEIQNEELRFTQDKLTLLRDEYLELYDHAPVGYCSIAPQGVVLRTNLTLARLLGELPDRLLGRNLEEKLADEDRDNFYLWLKALREKADTPTTFVGRLLRPDGSSFWSRFEASFAKEGEEERAIRLVVADISNERATEEALRVADRLQSLEALAGGIAHDFNNLLAGILGYMDLARAVGEPSATTLRYLDKASSVFGRARDLTHQLLTFSKRNTPQSKVTDLAVLVHKSSGFCLSGTATQVLLDAPADLWSICVDENQIGQVLDNLFVNASQAMKGGGTVAVCLRNAQEATIGLRAVSAGRYCEVLVTDTGGGIAPGAGDRIFDPFFTTKSTGHGLGLATSHSIVTKHGGSIWVDSVEGQGCTFHLLLPAAQACSDPEASRPTTPTRHRGSGRVLVMDDEDYNVEILGSLLRGMGYLVLEAANGEEALAFCGPEILLKSAFLDLTIKGGLGGRQTAEALRRLHPGLPIFAVSGFSEDPIMAAPQDYGFSTSLSKPFRKEELHALLEKYFPSSD